jgi:ubiquinone/menaquinone biosynthesis C-methylase UbiE/uncharacterized protein YbaR (Trm112 family)
MINSPSNLEFERSKIYEKLDYRPQPADYKGKLSWIVQQQIAATNGIQYVDKVGKMQDYPAYELPVKKVAQGIMLDIGCGWGRWLMAGIEKGYIPVGIDLRLEFCETTLATLKNKNGSGYVVVADLKELPFRDNTFDFVWSFSVIQHTHKVRLISCLQNIHRILKGGGFTKLEFPNKNGFRNKRGPVKSAALTAEDYDSWAVRYYSIKKYHDLFTGVFDNFKYTVHSFLGIGVLKEDLKYVSFKNKILCAVSLGFTALSKFIHPLKAIADSIYIQADKKGSVTNTSALNNFLNAHALQPGNNLNIIHLLQCPITGSSLRYSTGDINFVYNEAGSLRYPVVNNIPVVIRSEAQPVV